LNAAEPEFSPALIFDRTKFDLIITISLLIVIITLTLPFEERQGKGISDTICLSVMDPIGVITNFASPQTK
jgi:hypothetical protein